LSSLASGSVYYAYAYTYDGFTYTWGNVISFLAGSTAAVNYNCIITNDVLVNSSTYQFDVYIYGVSSGFSLNNYQLGFELNNVDWLANRYMTGNYVAGTSTLVDAAFVPGGMTLALQTKTPSSVPPHPYDHMDVRVNGLPPSSGGTAIPLSPGLRIGTFILRNWTDATHSVAKPFGSVTPNLSWDDDFIGRTYVYALISGQAVLITNLFSSHIKSTNNYGLNAANWSGVTNSDWTDVTNWFGYPASDISTFPPNSSESVVIPAKQVSGSYSSPVISTSSPLPTCKNLYIGNGTYNANLTIAPTGNLTVAGAIYNPVGTAGLTIQSNATYTGSLLHNSDTINATIQRYVPGDPDISLKKYHMVSVPLDYRSLPTTNIFLNSYLFNFSENSNQWVILGASTTTQLVFGSGELQPQNR